MEITKFRLQLSSAVEQVTVHLWQVHHKFTKVTRIAAERAPRLGRELRTREKALRVLLVARCREAIVAASSKVTKAKAQVSIAFKKGTGHLREAQNRLARLRKRIAEKRQKQAEERRARKLQKPPKELRAREDGLRVPEARPREGVVGANKITKVKAQPAAAPEQWTAHLLQAHNPLAGLTRSIAEKPQKLPEEPRARENELRVPEARPREATPGANSKITKVRARVSAAFVKGTGHPREAQNPLAGLTRSTAGKPQKPPEELRAREDELRVPEARPREANVEADRKISKVEAQPPAAFGQWTEHLLQAQNPLAGLTRSIAGKPQKPPEEPRTQENELRVPEARPREATVAANSQVTRAKGRVSSAIEHGAARLRRARKRLAGLGGNTVDKRQRGRQEVGARESQMRELLANSPDAIAVINGDHCFVTANQRALDLFGVSEKNLRKFNIDVFLFRGQIPDLHQNGSFFMGRPERHGKCMIRRVDGSMRAAEFAFVADFLPLQHLCRFYDLRMPQRPTPMQHRIGPETPTRCAPSR